MVTRVIQLCTLMEICNEKIDVLINRLIFLKKVQKWARSVSNEKKKKKANMWNMQKRDWRVAMSDICI